MPIKDFLSRQSFPLRCDCPICGHHNTFSANQENGQVYYKCFHADCNIGGRLDVGLTIDNISNINSDIRINNTSFVIPDHFTSPLRNPQSIAFMRRWGLIEKYAKGLELYYDPLENRVCFPLRGYDGKLYGITGRAINYPSNIKWRIYQRIGSCPYINYSTTRQVLLVEDCISVVRASSVSSSIALLGTNIPAEMYRFLEPYSKIFIALDADATKKSLQLQKELSIIKPTEVIILKKDIKYYNAIELEELRKCLITD